jgi:hypothetical protein
MRPRPIIAAASSVWPDHSQPIAVMKTIPIPDHSAYAMPTGTRSSVSDRK